MDLNILKYTASRASNTQFEPVDFRYWLLLFAVCAALAASTTPVCAGNLYVPNFSFESQPTPFADPRIDSWQKAAQPASFDPVAFGSPWTNLVGVFSNPPPPSADNIDNAKGTQLAFLFNYPQVAIFQDYDTTDWAGGPPTHAFNSLFEVGKAYRLTVGITTSSHLPLTQGATLQLSLYYRDALSNIVTVAATTVTYDTNVFTNMLHLLDFQVNVPVVQSNQPWAGQNIGIQFLSTVPANLVGGVWDLDNVRLTELIYVPNFSFESQVTPFAGPQVDSWQKAPEPQGFDTNAFGAWENMAGLFSNQPPAKIDNAESNQLAYLVAYPTVALFQDFNSTDWMNAAPTHAFNSKFKVGKSYTLSVGLSTSSFQPLNQGSPLLMSLYYRDALSNMVTVAATTVIYDTNVFTNLTHLIDFQTTLPEVKANDPWVGQNIGIAFQSVVPPQLIGGVWDLDNVRLTEIVGTSLKNPTRTASQFGFTLQSEPGLAFQILVGTNAAQPLLTWTNIVTVTNVTGTTSFTDSSANTGQRFYRARLVP